MTPKRFTKRERNICNQVRRESRNEVCERWGPIVNKDAEAAGGGYEKEEKIEG